MARRLQPSDRRRFVGTDRRFFGLQSGAPLAQTADVRTAGFSAGFVAAIFLTIPGVSPGAAAERTDENPAAPQSNETGGVVTTTAWVNGLIAEGMANSGTFAGIASQLLTSNVIATVEPALQLQTGLSGYMAFITRTPTRRYVRIYFNPKLQRHQSIAIIGHELRHALEVAMHPEVVNQSTLRAMYAVVGRGEGDRWDSEGAVEAGRTILRELTSPPTVVATDDGR